MEGDDTPTCTVLCVRLTLGFSVPTWGRVQVLTNFEVGAGAFGSVCRFNLDGVLQNDLVVRDNVENVLSPQVKRMKARREMVKTILCMRDELMWASKLSDLPCCIKTVKTHELALGGKNYFYVRPSTKQLILQIFMQRGLMTCQDLFTSLRRLKAPAVVLQAIFLWMFEKQVEIASQFEELGVYHRCAR